MRVFSAAVLIVALAAVPANAQMGSKHHRGDDNKSEQRKPKVDEAAYKAALERIPAKEKYDPWGVARPAEPTKKPR